MNGILIDASLYEKQKKNGNSTEVKFPFLKTLVGHDLVFLEHKADIIRPLFLKLF